MQTYFERLPRVLLRADLAHLLSPTYASQEGVDVELAHERMTQILKSPHLTDKIYRALAGALVSVQGSRTEDEVLQALSKVVLKRCEKIGAAPASPAMSAFTVLLNLELGVSPQSLRATLESDMGQSLLQQGFEKLGTHIVGHLLG